MKTVTFSLRLDIFKLKCCLATLINMICHLFWETTGTIYKTNKLVWYTFFNFHYFCIFAYCSSLFSVVPLTHKQTVHFSDFFSVLPLKKCANRNCVEYIYSATMQHLQANKLKRNQAAGEQHKTWSTSVVFLRTKRAKCTLHIIEYYVGIHIWAYIKYSKYQKYWDIYFYDFCSKW